MTASVFIPVAMNDAVLIASNIPETDAPAWSAGSYTTGNTVVYQHAVYEALTTGASVAAPPDDPIMWVYTGATNRWRPFDGSLGQDAEQSGTITYTLVAPSKCDAIAFIGLAAVSVKVLVKDVGGSTLYNETRTLVDVSGVTDWFEFFTYEAVYEPEQVFTELPPFAGNTFYITLDGEGGMAAVGEIVFGREVPLGTITSGSRSGFTDYTDRKVDPYGNITQVVRPTANKAEWQLAFDARSNRRIQRELQAARGLKSFFYPGDGAIDFYLSVFGVADEFYPALEAGGTSYATLSLTGVS